MSAKAGNKGGKGKPQKGASKKPEPKKEDFGKKAVKEVKQQKEVRAVNRKGHVERELVRIAGIDIDGYLSLDRALRAIKGIGIRTARTFAYEFENKTKIPFNTLIGNIPPERDELLTNIVMQANIPEWMVNRKRDLYDGKTKHITGSDLIFTIREDKQRLSRIKSRRGMRLQAALPVRGQKTKSNFRRKQGVVGVVKKK